MNNDLKNFLEEEKINVYQAMDSFLTEYDTFEGKPARRSLEKLNRDRHLFVENMQLHDTRLINFVLDLVEKEVEKIDTGFETVFNYQYRVMKEQVSTIIKNLRV